jgi:hypothetical protein
MKAFELGGHSLATRVVSRLQVVSGQDPSRAVFDNPTLAEMGHFIAIVEGLERWFRVPGRSSREPYFGSSMPQSLTWLKNQNFVEGTFCPSRAEMRF